MIPVVLVTGFLGSGKTTFLQQITTRWAGRRIAYLVNEFSPRDVDGGRLEIPPGGLHVVAGGSIFCRCTADQSRQALLAVAALQPPVEGVVIEATGMADPRAFPTTLWELKLDTVFQACRVVTVIDPLSFRKVRSSLPAMDLQVAAADTVLINKEDTVAPEAIAKTRIEVLALNPEAEILVTRFSQADCALFTPGRWTLAATPPAKVRDPHFGTAWAPIASPVDWPRLRDAIDGLGASLLRAKGTVPTRNGPLQVDFSTAGWDERPAQHLRDPEGRIVLIVVGNAERKAIALAERIAAGIFAG